MPGPPCATGRTVLPPAVRLLTGALAAAVLLLGPGAGMAAAHDVLVAAGPAQGATVETPPQNVTLEFSDAPQALGTQVEVTGPDGAPVSEGEPARSGVTVTQPLDNGLPAGDYTVRWRVTSADGHPLSGTFGFTVARGVGDRSAAGPAGTDNTPHGGTDAFPVVWLAVGAILVVAVVLVARQLRRTG